MGRDIPRFLASSMASSRTFRSLIVPSKVSFITLNCVSNSLSRPSTSQPVKLVTVESLTRKGSFVGEHDLVGDVTLFRGLLANVCIVPYATLNDLICDGVAGADTDADRE